MNVSDFMRGHVVTTSPSAKLPQVFNLIFKKRVHALPVVDRGKKLLGIVTREDILTKLYPQYEDAIEDWERVDELTDFGDKIKKLQKLTAEKIMNRKVIHTRVDTTIMRALSRMIVQRLRQLPVLDEDDRVVGMISKADIFNKLFGHPK